jgi:hypothetical protein
LAPNVNWSAFSVNKTRLEVVHLCIEQNHKKMKTIRTEVRIQAPIHKVWQALMDFERYPEWNLFIHVTGQPTVGKHLENTIYLAGQSPQVFKPIVLKVDHEKEFRWKGKLFISGLFDGEHYFLLEKFDEQSTRLIHGENFTGLLVRPILGMIGTKTQEGFERMNLGLKEWVEVV